MGRSLSSEVMGPPRPLRSEEQDVVAAILRSSAAGKELLKLLPNCQVQEMADGGMGSLRFVSERSDRRFGRSIAEAEFVDDDGVLVSVAVHVDDKGNLFELDMWKTDFSSLKRFPRLDDLQPSGAQHRKP